jgi:hypothetical protein
MNGKRIITLVIFLIAALSSPCLADYFYYFDLSGYSSGPCISGDYLTVTVIGIFEFDTPAKGVRFSAPPAWNVTVGGEWVLFPYTGDLTNGIYVDFDSCLTGEVSVFVRDVTLGSYGCLGIIEGYSGAGSLPIVIDCNDFEYALHHQACGHPDPPYNLVPVNGAESVVLTPTLSWEWDIPGYCFEGLGLTIFSIYLGTDPENLPLMAWTDGYMQAPVGPLMPDTQYYWYIYVNDSFWEYPGSHEAETDIHTFTTEAPINAEESSWGRIKILYK